MVKTIHFILPGGGVRGSFQAGFLYELFTKYKNSFEIYRIDGTSVGSINGITTLLGEYEVLKNNWLNINNINDFFGNWSNTSFINIYYGFYKNGIYDHTTLKNKLIDNLEKKKNNTNKEILDKFSCPVIDVLEAKLEYINGSNSNIFEFVTASASPWVLSNPIEINNKIYTDGSLLETYPIKYVDNSGADLVIIVGFDQEVVNFEKPNCTNLIYFLVTLIDIARFNSINSKKIVEYIEKGICIPIINPMTCLFTDFTPETIHIGFEQGRDSAEQFYKTYLQNYLEYFPNE